MKYKIITILFLALSCVFGARVTEATEAAGSDAVTSMPGISIAVGMDDTAGKLEVQPTDGVFLVGICNISESGDQLANATVFKTAGEIDWEKRAEAIEGYTNLGVALVDSYLNVRKSAGTDGDIIGKMTNYNICEVLETSSDGKWLKIKSGSITGWVSSDYIQTGWEAVDTAKAEAELQVIIDVDTLNVRTEPDVNSTIWTQADGNERYDVVRDLGDWIEIELDDSTGYVAKDFVRVKYALNTAVKYVPPEDDENQPLGSRIVTYAIKWLGGRYVWGGETLGKGVDCSGFTKCVYAHFGIYLTHYSGSQAAEGKRISRSELKKGDLVFYAKNGTINHVAIYIGDGQVVHARSARRGICITDIGYRTPVRYVTYIH